MRKNVHAGRIAAFVLSLSLVLGNVTPAYAADFSDVSTISDNEIVASEEASVEEEGTEEDSDEASAEGESTEENSGEASAEEESSEEEITAEENVEEEIGEESDEEEKNTDSEETVSDNDTEVEDEMEEVSGNDTNEEETTSDNDMDTVSDNSMETSISANSIVKASEGNTIDSMDALIEKFGAVITEAGKEITVNSSIVLGGTITITEDIILLPQGKVTIKRGPSMAKQHMFLVEEGASLTIGKKDMPTTDVLIIDGGAVIKKITKGSGDYQYYHWVNEGSQTYSATAIYNEAGGTLVLEDGIVIQNNAIYTGNLYQEEPFTWLGRCEIASAITNFGNCTMNGGVIQNNQAIYYDIEKYASPGNYGYTYGDETAAIVLNCGENAVFIMNDGLITENFSINYEPCVLNVLGTFEINGGELKGTTNADLQHEFQEPFGIINCGNASFTGGKIHNFGVGIWNCNTVALLDSYPGELTYIPTLTMSGGRIEVKNSLKKTDDENTYNNNRGIRNQGNFTMSGGTIWVPEQGGDGIENTTWHATRGYSGPDGYIEYEHISNGKANLCGGHIIGHHNPAKWYIGRSMGVFGHGVLHISGDIVIEGFRKGVYFTPVTKETYESFEGEVSSISGGIIRNNVEDGVTAGHPVEMTGGSILNNLKDGVQVTGNGGKEYVQPEFTMDGGIIKGNGTYLTKTDYSNYAGIYVRGYKDAPATFILNNGLIKGNKSFFGSAVFGERYANITLNGGEITGNFSGSDKSAYYPNYENTSGITDGSVYLEMDIHATEGDTNTLIIAEGKKDEIIHHNYIGQTPVETKVTSMLQKMTLTVGQEESLKTVTTPAGAQVVYTSTHPEVASVDENGNVTALTIGATKIWASIDDEIMAECEVSVKNLQINCDAVNDSLGRGDTATITLVEERSDGEFTEIAEAAVWTSSSENVLAVEGNGSKAKITGIGAGTATVTAVIGKNTENEVNEITVTKEIQVCVPVTGIQISQKEKTIHLPYGDATKSQTIKAYVTPADANEAYVIKWKSDNEQIISVDAEGTLVSYTALNKGVANITAELYAEDGKTLKATSQPCKIIVTRGFSATNEADKTYGVLTNTHATLADIKLDDNYRWKESYEGESEAVKLESYHGLQHFTAIYENVDEYLYQELSVPVAVGTLSGVNVTDAEGNALSALKVEVGDDAKQKVNIDAVGEIYQLSEDYQMETTIEVTKGGEGLVIEKEGEQWTIKAADAAKGKTYTIAATIVLPGENKADKKQKGKLWFEKTLTVSVLKDGQTLAKALNVCMAEGEGASMEEENGVKCIYKGKEHLEKGNNTISLNTKAFSATGTDISGSTKVKWTTSNKTVATVDSKGKITLKGIGTAIVTATANDGSNASDSVIIQVKDYCPRLEQKTITLNCMNESGEVLRFHMPEDVRWTNEHKVEVYVYNSKTKVYESASDKFEITYANQLFTINLKDDAKVAANKKADYTLALVPVVENCTTDEIVTIEPKYGCALKLSVINKAPKVTVKQTGKVNLFYKDVQGIVAITTDHGVISKVTWVNGESADFTIVHNQNVLTLQPQLKAEAIKTDGSIDLKKVDAKGKINVHFSEMDSPVQVNLNISVEYKKPTYVFKIGSLSLYPGYGIQSGWDTIIDKTSKAVIDLSDISENVKTEGFTISNVIEQEGRMELTADENAPAKKAEVILSCDNWNGTVSVAETIKVAQPKPVLSEKTITLNKKNILSNTEPLSVIMNLNGSEYVTGFEISKIEGADAKTKEVMKDASLVVRKAGETAVTVGLQEYKKGEQLVSVPKGSYNIMITPGITVNGNKVELESQKLTVKVEEKDVTAALKGKGKINNLNRYDVSGTIYTVTMKNTSAKPVDVKMIGNDSSIVSKTLIKNGSVEIYFKEDADLKLKRTYQMVPVLTLSDGTTVSADAIKMTVSQPSVKAVTDVKSVTIYASEDKDVNHGNLHISIQSKDSYLAGDGIIRDVVSLTKGFAYDLNTHSLVISDPEWVAMNKTNTVKLAVTLNGEAIGGKQITVSIKADVKP